MRGQAEVSVEAFWAVVEVFAAAVEAAVAVEIAAVEVVLETFLEAFLQGLSDEEAGVC